MANEEKLGKSEQEIALSGNHYNNNNLMERGGGVVSENGNVTRSNKVVCQLFPIKEIKNCNRAKDIEV